MSENKDIQGKSTQITGLKKSVHKSVLKDGEYHHLKNGTISSFEGLLLKGISLSFKICLLI